MKTLLNLLALFLIAVGVNAQTVLYENDFTGITEFTGWSQFDDSQTDGRVDVDPNGVAITVGIQTGQLWQPHVMIVPDGSFDLEEDGDYTVVITAKFPTAGTLQINMGSWSANDQATFPVGASDEFQTIECDFAEWSVTAEGAHLLFDCGDFKGTTIVKKIKIIKGIQKPFNPANIRYNFITKGKVAEVISNPNKKYRGIVEIPATVTHEGETYTVTKIGDYAFSSCNSLSSVTIPNSVTSIGHSAFLDCRNLTSVSLPNSVTTIGDNAFAQCYSLTSMIIPNSVTSLGADAFYLCSKLTSVLIPNKITHLPNGLFQSSGLTSVTIPNNVTNIGISVFSNCKSLTTITLSNTQTSIGYYAFSGCAALSSVTIPNSVEDIDEGAFAGCSGLTSVIIPNSVESIKSNAFKGCSSLTSATIGSSVNSIGSGAFANCSLLADVICLAESVPSTATDVFNDSYIEYSTLHVPATSLNSYMNTDPWKKFQSKVAISNGEIPETPKCAKPEINFANGKVSFSCATEGVEYISEVTVTDAHKYYDSEIDLSQTYKVSVFATKTNYINSDVTTREIEIKGDNKPIVVGDVDGDGKVNVADHVKLSDIIMEK